MGRVTTLVLLCCVQAAWMKYIKDANNQQASEIPIECKLYGICERVDNYPTALAKELIAMLQNNILSNNEPPEISLEGRMGDDERNSLCEGNLVERWPESAEDENGNIQTILNDREVPFQKLAMELCHENNNNEINNRNSQCYKNIFSMGYKGECVQNDKLQQMYYIDKTEKTSKLGFFIVPTCCSCALKQTNNKKKY